MPDNVSEGDRAGCTVLIPQNAEWTNTSKMVKKISEANGRNIAMVKAMWPILVLAEKCRVK